MRKRWESVPFFEFVFLTARLDIMSKRSSFFAKYTSPFHGIYNIIFFVFIEKQKDSKEKEKKGGLYGYSFGVCYVYTIILFWRHITYNGSCDNIFYYI